MIFLKKTCFLLILAALLLLSGCSGKSRLTAADLYDAIAEKIHIPESEIYSYVPDDSQDKRMIRLYGETGDEVPPAALSLCDDYLVCLYKGNHIWELHIFRTVSIYENQKLVDMLLKRRDLLQKSDLSDYLSEEDAERVAAAEVLTCRNFVVLAVTDENEAVRRIINAIP